MKLVLVTKLVVSGIMFFTFFGIESPFFKELLVLRIFYQDLQYFILDFVSQYYIAIFE